MVGQEVLNMLVSKIADFSSPDKIILFGSYANGNANNNSDLDILVIKDSDKPRPERAAEIRKALFGFMIPMDILVYTNQEIKEALKNKYSFAYEAIKNGKVLYERK